MRDSISGVSSRLSRDAQKRWFVHFYVIFQRQNRRKAPRKALNAMSPPFAYIYPWRQKGLEFGHFCAIFCSPCRAAKRLWGPALGLGRKNTRFLTLVKLIFKYSHIICSLFIENCNILSRFMAWKQKTTALRLSTHLCPDIVRRWTPSLSLRCKKHLVFHRSYYSF